MMWNGDLMDVKGDEDKSLYRALLDTQCLRHPSFTIIPQEPLAFHDVPVSD